LHECYIVILNCNPSKRVDGCCNKSEKIGFIGLNFDVGIGAGSVADGSVAESI